LSPRLALWGAIGVLAACSSSQSTTAVVGTTRQADISGDAGAVPAEGEYSVFRRVPGSPAPGARYQTALAFDPAQKQTVLFGGDGTDDTANTWGFDGAWHELCAEPACGGPGARVGAGLAASPGRGVVVLFGGYDSASGENRCDTWEWDGALKAWSPRLSPACTANGDAAGRVGLAMTDLGTRVVYFGGRAGNGSAPPALTNDLNAWDGASWSSLCDGTCLSNAPEPRAAATLVHATTAGHDELILFGGRGDSDLLNDVWAFDPATHTWSRRCQSAACKTAAPAPRTRHGAAFDTLRGRMVVHAGCGNDSCNPPLNDAFDYDPVADMWAPIPAPSSSGFPDKKADFGIAFDAQRGHVVEFGGFVSGPFLADTVEFYTRGGPCTASADCDTHICQKKNAGDAAGTCAEPCSPGDAEVGTGACVNGFRCNTQCDVPCRTCAAVPGVCTAIVRGPDDEAGSAVASRCAGSQSCDEHGACKFVVGQTCSVPGDCVTGNCAKYGSSVCTAVDCGNSACLQAAADGSCKAVPFPKECAGSTCDASGRCRHDCTKDDECDLDYFCDIAEGGSSGVCARGKRLGGKCDTSQDCGKGTCYDGVCCERPCGDSCEACSAEGKCLPIGAGEAPRPGHPPCLGEDGGVCAGRCDGKRTDCYYPGDVTPCGSGTCFERDWRIGQVCDQHGACVQTPEAKSCGAYSCGQGVCQTQCTANADCARAAECDLSGETGVCRSKGVGCTEDNSAVKTTSGAVVSCGGYPCVVNICVARPCGSDDDCTPGYACTPDHRCVEATPSPDGGHAAKAPPGSSSPTEKADAARPDAGTRDVATPAGTSCAVNHSATGRSAGAPLYVLAGLIALALRRRAEREARHREYLR
jgi:hypothetical protein